MRSPMTITLFSLALLLSSGCVGDEGDAPGTQERSAKFEPAKLPEAASKPAPVVAAPELPAPPSSAPAAMPEQWQAWVSSEVARVQTESPEWFEHVMTVEPKRTRSGFLRLVGPELEDPNAVPVLLHRYLTAGESTEVKAAVLAALVRTQGDYAKVVGDLLGSEPDALVRVGMVSSLRRVPGSDALAAIEIALADADPQVRVAAANVASRHPEGATLAAPLIDALDDLPDVQLAASRSLGYLHVQSATAALAGLLASADADVRLSSLQAIDRIDPAYAEGLTQLAALVGDADPKVARAAQKIASR
jgi:hypothetical protein